MHQPFYYDPLMKEMALPWVRLHGIRGYNDLPYMIGTYPAVRHTVNLVPSLLDQIDMIASGSVTDTYFRISARPAADLTAEEKVFLLRNFFSCPFESMIKPYPRYASLWSRAYSRPAGPSSDWERLSTTLGTRDYLDLQVWFNLTWFGYAARKHFPIIEEWIRKGSQYSEEEKREILSLQIHVVQGLMGRYKTLQDQGCIEISTSPYYHPILPLLISSRIARRPRPELDLPEEFAWPDDAKGQISQALDLQKKLWGKRPVGMWPSEGSVCPELVAIAADEGIGWMATDEEILKLSKSQENGGGLSPYQSYVLAPFTDGPRLIFRDRGLSDRIGFLYARYNGTEAALDLVSNLERIENLAVGTKEPPLIPIILDGENPWETYPDGGYLFLHSFLERLEHHPKLQGMTVSEALSESTPSVLSDLASGSWINHDFNIWIGHREDNTAWNHLGRTRQFLENEIRSGVHSREKIATARDEMYAAEGSDWFWWFGDDFQTLQASEFDRLFRVHQQNIYRIFGKEVPLALNEPVQERVAGEAIVMPVDFIHPIIDGEVTNYYEWSGSGSYDSRKAQGAMFLHDPFLQKLYFGFDQERFYLRIDLNPELAETDTSSYRLVVRFTNKRDFEWKFPLRSGELDVPSSGGEGPPVVAVWACRKIGEMSVSIRELGLSPGEPVYVTVELYDGGDLIDQCPRGRAILVHAPDDRFAQSIWRV